MEKGEGTLSAVRGDKSWPLAREPVGGWTVEGERLDASGSLEFRGREGQGREGAGRPQKTRSAEKGMER